MLSLQTFLRHSRHLNKSILTLRVLIFIRGTRAVEAQFQIEAPDPYPLLKRRTDLGMQVVLSIFDSVTFITMFMLPLEDML